MNPSPTFFKAFNRAMLTTWRLGLGPLVNSLPDHVGRIMILTTIGRKSGRPRRTPLNYAHVGNEVYCLAGYGPGSDWLKNLQANPSAEVWLPEGRWKVEASPVTHPVQRGVLLRLVLCESGFATPLFLGFNPHEASDETIAQACEGIEVMRLHMNARIDESAADLTWVWPALGGALLSAAFIKPLLGCCPCRKKGDRCCPTGAGNAR